MSNYIIRQALERDIPRILTLLEDIANIHHISRPDIFKANSRKYNSDDMKKILSDEKTPVFVVTDKDEYVLAYCICMINSVEENPVLYPKNIFFIDDLCVSEETRGTGLGTKFFEYIKDFAQNLGYIDSIELNVWEDNPKAIKFYELLGLKTKKRVLEMPL